MTNPGFRLRPLNIGDLLDETFRLYRRHFAVFAAIAAVALVPVPVLQILLSIDPADPGRAIGAGILLGIVSFLATQLMNGAMIHAVSQGALGESPGVGAAYGRVRPKLLSLAGLSIVYGLAVGLMFVTVIGIPFALFFALAWSMSTQALVLEGEGVCSSLGRSRELLRGSWWRTLGYATVLGILTVIAVMVASIPSWIVAGLNEATGPAPALSALGTLLETLGQVIGTPVGLAGWTLYYYDLRVRKEGFDLEVLARSLGS